MARGILREETITLCYRCKQCYSNAGEELRRTEKRIIEKCDYCNRNGGYEYKIIRHYKKKLVI